MKLSLLFDRIPVRIRLSVGHALWMAVLFLAVGFGIHHLAAENLFQSVDAALLATAQSLRDSKVSQGMGDLYLDDVLADLLGEKAINATAQVVDLSGKVKHQSDRAQVSLPVTPSALRRAERGLATFETFKSRGSRPFRQVTIPIMFQGRFSGDIVQVGSSLESTYAALREISVVLWFALPTGLVLSILFGYQLAKRSLKPVNEMRRAAATLSAHNLQRRLKLPPACDELRDLAVTFNGMFDRLEDAFERLRRFSADVSHELRTPLAVLRAEAELALRRTRSPEEYQQALQSVAREAGNMSLIIEDLLLLAKAQSRSVAMHWQKVLLADFVAEVCRSVEAVFAAKNIRLSVEVTAGIELRVATTYLHLALKNLLLNAAKHSAPDSKVAFHAKMEQEQISFTVRDWGEGIPAEAQPYIFDAFYRVDSARNRASGGSGIGLSLAMAMVKLHEGNIVVHSEVGVGTVFTVTVPTNLQDEKPSKLVSSLDAPQQIGQGKTTASDLPVKLSQNFADAALAKA